MDNSMNGGAEALTDEQLFAQLVEAGAAPADDGGTTEPPAPVAEAQPETVAEAAPVAAQPAAQTPSPEPEVIRHVPLGELLTEREKRQEAERRFAAYREQVEAQQRQAEASRQPVELFDDPARFVEQAVAERFRELQQHMLYNARIAAEGRFGEDHVKEAETAFMEAVHANRVHQSDVQRVVSSPNRYIEAVKWFEQQRVLSEVGTDPAAYKARIIEEALKDPEIIRRAVEQARASAASAGHTTIQLQSNPAPRQTQSLPSLARVGATALTPDPEPPSDDELFNSVTNAPRRRRR